MNMSSHEPTPLTLEVLKNAVANNAAALRCLRTLQPEAGPGGKVFPPTFAGAVYAVEKRRVPGRDEPVTCVVLDTVQSQANRMEAALQEALDDNRLTLPIIAVDFSEHAPTGDVDSDEKHGRLIDNVGKITCLQVPHRLADAILRDSESKEGVPFRKTDAGKLLNKTSNQNATALYRYCPTALVFGMWDSTGPKGGLGAKFERAMVSEVIGINAEFGLKTASRIDPLITGSKGIILYKHQDDDRVWTLEEANAAKDISGKPIKLGKKDPGKVSNSNLGNVTPGFAKYTKGAEGYDPMQARLAHMRYEVKEGGRESMFDSRIELEEPIAREGRIAPGGVTISHAEQLTTLSLIALRRLRFPVENAKDQTATNKAAQTVIAALGVCAATLAFENGMGLRSRCLLWPDAAMTWEILAKPGESPQAYALDGNLALQLLAEAVAEAKTAQLEWETEPVELKPSDDLLKLVRLSQLQAVKSDTED